MRPELLDLSLGIAEARWKRAVDLLWREVVRLRRTRLEKGLEIAALATPNQISHRYFRCFLTRASWNPVPAAAAIGWPV